jgi:hypothetical protein
VKREGGAEWQPGKQTHNAVVQMTNAARRSANKCRNLGGAEWLPPVFSSVVRRNTYAMGSGGR